LHVTATKMAGVTWARRLGLAVIALVIAVGLLFWYFIARPWSNLRERADDLRLPPGAEVLKRTESGTMFCLVSCSGDGEAQIEFLIGTGDHDPCAYLRPSVQRLAGRSNVEQPPLGYADGCLYAKLPQVRSSAYLIGQRCSNGGGCLQLTLSSGVE